MLQELYPTNAGYRTRAPKTKPLPLRLNRILAEGRAQTNTAHIAQSSGTTNSRHTYTNALASVHRRQVRGLAIRSSCNFRHGRRYWGSPDFSNAHPMAAWGHGWRTASRRPSFGALATAAPFLRNSTFASRQQPTFSPLAATTGDRPEATLALRHPPSGTGGKLV